MKWCIVVTFDLSGKLASVPYYAQTEGSAEFLYKALTWFRAGSASNVPPINGITQPFRMEVPNHV